MALDLETKEGGARLLLSLFGRRSNVYYLDAEGRVAAALRPLDATRPELSLGEPWTPPGASPPRAGEDRFAATDDAGLFGAIEAAYGEREAEGAHAELARRIEQALKKEGRRIERKLEKLEAELAAAETATELARHGEALELFRARRFEAAARAFGELVARAGPALLYELYVERSRRFHAEPPDADWDGTVRYDEK